MKPIHVELVVVGGGPGGYAAAFYGADKGMNVALVDQERRLGGVCLLRGCIPSKALLHAAKVVMEAKESAIRGIHFGAPTIEVSRLRSWKDSIVERLAGGINGLARKRNVEVVQGRGYFENSTTLRVETPEGQRFLSYDRAIIAVGSRAALPAAFDLGNPRVMTSDQGLDVEEVPARMLVVGAGYIGLELGTVYATLGTKIVLAEALDVMLAGVDADLVRPVMRYAQKAFAEVRLNAKVTSMATAGRQIRAVMEHSGKTLDELYDRVLVAVGRAPNCEDLGLENTKVTLNERGFIQVNDQQQTTDSALYAIGDVTGGALLAHKASREARVAVEVITGETSSFRNIIIPAVVFTDPEVAWCGLTESEARAKGITVEVARFPWSASGRSLTLDRVDGLTKLIVEPESERILGVGLVGPGAGELISEGVLAIEMGATARDLAESIHPHPTLSETLMECAEVFYGQATHIYTPKKKPAAVE
jgi:dihydrolipoamide dehydrogenase